MFVLANRSGAMHKLHTVADIPTLNWLLVEKQRDTGTSTNGLYPESKLAKWRIEDGILRADNENSLFAAWNFFGVLRNDMDAGSLLQKLLNCDVFGRAKVANLFSSKRNGIRRGDHVGLAVVKFNLEAFKVLHHPSGGDGMPVQMMGSVTSEKEMPMLMQATLLKDSGYEINDDDNDDDDEEAEASRFAYQIVGTLNGVPSVDSVHLTDFDRYNDTFDGNTEERIKKACVLHHIPLGIVSHAVAKVPSDAARLYALKCTEDMTNLPQIEILMM